MYYASGGFDTNWDGHHDGGVGNSHLVQMHYVVKRFHSHSCRVHSYRFLFFFGRPPKTSSKLDGIGNSGTKLDRV